MAKTRGYHLQTADDAVAFAVAFAQMDLPRLSATDLRTVDRRVVELQHYREPGRWVEARVPDLTALSVIQRRLAGLVAGFADASGVAIAGDLLLSFLAQRDTKTGAVQLTTLGSEDHRTLYAVIRAAQAAGLERVRRCPASKCGQVFFKRGRAEFCSTRCQMRTLMQKARRAAKEKEEEVQRGKAKRTTRKR